MPFETGDVTHYNRERAGRRDRAVQKRGLLRDPWSLFLSVAVLLETERLLQPSEVRLWGTTLIAYFAEVARAAVY